MNPKAPRASVFIGWKEMDQYMRDNKIEGAASTAVVNPEAEEQSVASSKEKAAAEPKERRSNAKAAKAS